MDEGLDEFKREDAEGYTALLSQGNVDAHGRKAPSHGAEVFKDDLTGQVLDNKLVKKAALKIHGF